MLGVVVLLWLIHNYGYTVMIARQRYVLSQYICVARAPLAIDVIVALVLACRQ